MMEKTEAVYEELRRLGRKRRGRLTPDVVVTIAADPESPLHACFEWDDSEAARKYRIEQARVLIRSVPLVITDEKRTIETVHYVRDPAAASNSQGYVAIQSLMGDQEMANKAVCYEFERALAALQRAERIARALAVRRIVAAAKRHISKAKERIEKAKHAA